MHTRTRAHTHNAEGRIDDEIRLSVRSESIRRNAQLRRDQLTGEHGAFYRIDRAPIRQAKLINDSL